MKVSIIGAGKAAWFLAERLRKSGSSLYQVYNRTADRGQRLADEYNAEYVENIQNIDLQADALFFAVNDSLLNDLAEDLDFSEDTILVSLSGSRDIASLPYAEQWSVMWPIYSLLPEASDKDDIPLVFTPPVSVSLVEKAHILADALSEKQYILSQKKRLMAHLCAVFANNFVNFLNKEMFTIMKHTQLDNEMMQDIMQSTLKYSLSEKENAALTGPAARKDQDTIEHHIASLDYDPVLQKLYQDITQSIIEKSKK